jgi:N utilization substance protein B
MKNKRSLARELALKGYYQWLLSGNDPDRILRELREDESYPRCDDAYLERVWHGVTRGHEALMQALEPCSDRAVGSLSPIERGLLAIGAWELSHEPEIPYRVAIDEAVELAKRYGGTDGHKFVNGVLDKLAAATRSPEVAAARV